MNVLLNRVRLCAGGFYPVGGASVLAKAIVPTIERFGGAVLVRAMVKNIMMENGRVAGVVVNHAGKVCPLALS